MTDKKAVRYSHSSPCSFIPVPDFQGPFTPGTVDYKERRARELIHEAEQYAYFRSRCEGEELKRFDEWHYRKKFAEALRQPRPLEEILEEFLPEAPVKSLPTKAMNPVAYFYEWIKRNAAL